MGLTPARMEGMIFHIFWQGPTTTLQRAHRLSVVCPRRPLHGADLNVKWKVLDRNGAGRTVDPMGQPGHFALVVHNHVGVDHRRVVAGVRAETCEKNVS